MSYLAVYSDSDWAGEKITRRSTSGGIVAWGNGLIKSWSNRQSVVARSSGEAEYYSLGKSMSEAMGIRAVAADLGWDVKVTCNLDSSAAKAMASRIGLGKTRHIEVLYLWVQDVVKNKWIMLKKIPGDQNPSDILTKPKTWEEMSAIMSPLNVEL